MSTPLLTVGSRMGAAAQMGAQRAGLRALALGGDPVAAVLLGSPRVDPYAAYERVRARGPVVASRTGLRALTSHGLCELVLSDARFGVRHADGHSIDEGTLDGKLVGPLAGSFLDLDPPDHTRLRRVVAPAFRPKLVRSWAPRLEKVMHALLDRAEGRECFDLVADVAAPFPITVISELLGIEGVDGVRFAQIGTLAGQALDGVTSLRQADQLAAAGAELGELFARLAALRRNDPRDDVISRLAAAQAEGTVTGPDLLAVCGLLLIAGFETTVNLIGNAVAALLARPHLWHELVDDPGMAPSIVEETLRFDPSVQLTLRVTHEPVELAGVRLPAGALVMPILAAANRDPAVYRDPATFDPHRTDGPGHLTFSAGIHYCLGAPLARLEGEVALRVLAQRMPHLRLLPGARRRRGSTIRGYASLPGTQ